MKNTIPDVKRITTSAISTCTYHEFSGTGSGGGGQFGDAHAIIDGGHPGSTRPGTWTPSTQTGQY
jgi:hypothetical protein